MNEKTNVSDALKVDIRAAGQGPLVWLVNKIVTLKQWCRTLDALEPMIPQWVTPNGITIFRGLLTVPTVWLIIHGRPWWAVGVILVAGILDFFDGWLAEVRNLRTALGTVLDPVMDKTQVVFTLLANFAAAIALGAIAIQLSLSGLVAYVKAVVAAIMASTIPHYATYAMVLMIVIEVGIQLCRSLRMILWRPVQGGSTSRAQHVAAKWPGKMKMVCESLALPILVLAPLYPAALWAVGSALLLPAIAFGLCSLVSQLRD